MTKPKKLEPGHEMAERMREVLRATGLPEAIDGRDGWKVTRLTFEDEVIVEWLDSEGREHRRSRLWQLHTTLQNAGIAVRRRDDDIAYQLPLPLGTRRRG